LSVPSVVVAAELAPIAAFLNRLVDASLQIAGLHDAFVPANIASSQPRTIGYAEALCAALIDAGVDAERIELAPLAETIGSADVRVTRRGRAQASVRHPLHLRLRRTLNARHRGLCAGSFNGVVHECFQGIGRRGGCGTRDRRVCGRQ
jgi:hypothetical protein